MSDNQNLLANVVLIYVFEVGALVHNGRYYLIVFTVFEMLL